jgi:hypothetical protein
MSTDYRTQKRIRMADLGDGRLEEFGVRAAVEPIQSSARYLTDSHNYVWVFGNKSGFVDMITCYGFNNPTKILQAIAEAFGTDIFSEHEPQFWGFQTQEEWDAAWGARTKELQDEFYLELLKFACNEPNRIKPGTKQEIDAKIAKRLVEADPTLIQPGRREDLLKRISEAFIRDHVPEEKWWSDEAIAELDRLFAYQGAFCKGIRRY